MKTIIGLILFAASLSAHAGGEPRPPYVGAVAINPCRSAKLLADWYTKLGIETHAGEDGGFYGVYQTPAGPLVFGIHPKPKHAPKCGPARISVVFRVEDFDHYLAEVAERGLKPI